MFIRNAFLLLSACIFFLAGGTVSAQDTVDVVAGSRFHLEQDGQSLCIPIYSNRPLADPDPSVRRAVIMVHGTLRNADDYYQTIVDAAAGVEDESCLLIAPQFLTRGDLDAHDLSAEHLYWSYYGWRQGDLSASTAAEPRPWRISSFAVVDSLILRIAQVFPNLERVVVAGHSAGGQFCNRLAAGSRAEQALESRGQDILLRYIVANPSSYLYFSPERWTGTGSYQFAVPDGSQIAQCPGYDDYKFGLQDRNNYMSLLDENTLRAQYAGRQVIYLLGGNDTQWDYYLDTSCPADFEGQNRLERGNVYFAYLRQEFGGQITRRQRKVIIPGIGHDHYGIFTSDCGVRFLLDRGTCEEAQAAVSVSPAEGFSFSLEPDQTGSATLTVANTGAAGSLLHFSLQARDDAPPCGETGKTPGPGPFPTGKSSRNVGGSTLEVAPSHYNTDQVNGNLTFTPAGPYVLLLSPDGGEAWGVGEKVKILYSAGNGPENLRLELRRGDAGPWELLGENLPPEPGSFDWTVTGPMNPHCRAGPRDLPRASASDQRQR